MKTIKNSPKHLLQDRIINQLRNPFVTVPVVFFVVAAAFAVYSYTQLTELRQNPESVAQQEVEELVKRVGKLIILPEGEQPTVATVSDVESLREQQFFVQAKNGDKVLIYTNARKVILYDPVKNKIVDVAPLNFGETAAEEDEEQPETTPELEQ
ncbi:hypothetical protein IIB97_02490 [Patescibacteria group bacterium]|nr:hypothetical protein [Patescibacteria group bacterium]